MSESENKRHKKNGGHDQMYVCNKYIGEELFKMWFCGKGECLYVMYFFCGFFEERKDERERWIRRKDVKGGGGGGD